MSINKTCMSNQFQIQNSLYKTQLPPLKFDKKQSFLGQCIVCFEQIHTFKKYMNCEHRVICINCAERDLLSHINNKTQPKCLILACKAELDVGVQSLFACFNEETKRKWETKKKYNHLPTLRNCQVPNCQGYLNPNENICLECFQRHCQKCYRVQHQGECLGISYMVPHEMKIKTCIQCKNSIYKEGGCGRVQCLICRTYLCYNCEQKWTPKHHICSGSNVLLLPWFFLIESCCSDDSNISKESQSQIIQ